MNKDWDEQFDASVGLDFGLRALEIYPTSGTLSAEVYAVPGIRGHCQAYLELIEGKIVSCYVIDRTGKRHPCMKDALIKLDDARGPFSWTFRKTSTSTSAAPLRERAARPPIPQGPFPQQPARRPNTWLPFTEQLAQPSVLQIPFTDQLAQPPIPQVPLSQQTVKLPVSQVHSSQPPANPPVPQVPRFPVLIRLVHNLDPRQLQQWTPDQRRCLYMVFSMINGRCGINEIKERLPLPPTVVDTVIRILLQLQTIAIQ